METGVRGLMEDIAGDAFVVQTMEIILYLLGKRELL